nr:hypothetical protein BaRGS_024249 [Batillaria attramentaria]
MASWAYEGTWLLLERLTRQAVENALEAEKLMKQAKQLAKHTDDKAVQTEGGDLKSPGGSCRLLRRSGGHIKTMNASERAGNEF